MNRKMFVTQTSSSRMETLGLILFMWASLSGAFNVDTEHPLRFNGTPDDFFGYSVYQTEFGNRKQIIVGAPLQGNSAGQIYSCTADLQFCEQLQSPGSESVRFFGMSAAVSSAAVTSCSPYVPHECDGNSYLNGVCYQFNSSSQAVSNFTAAYQECTKREVNLVFLFDGSSSMKAHEFQMNKDFIKNIMKTLSNSSIKFAAVQFSSDIRTVFDFNDYQNGFAEEKLKNEAHMKSLTNTYRAINYILNNLLNNVLSGANPNAVKALVIITDGEPSDNDNKNVLKTCDEQNILRYVIGVGKVTLATVTHLASAPKHNNTFYIQQYSGLQGLLDNLQKKIYNIQGSKEAHGRDRQRELSQSGFSVVYYEDSVIVGSVGSNDWRGALYEVTGSGSEFRETEITDPAVSRDSYMGYSTVLGTRGGVPHLFSGAPRAEHTGLVTLFTKNKNTWTVTRNIKGEQIGSYFGASLSLLDVDSDGDSDFLLVGAPLFYQSQPRTEGRLYVYAFSEQNFQKMLNVSETTTGRFAASLASLKDLNGDSLSDVAVGAPLEDEGVVYIYLGDRTLGINPKHAPQRIPARSVLSGLQQFGVSLSGQMDMNDDNLTDIVIGAQGGIVLLKARPVMSVSAQLSFSPKEISLNYFECPGDSAFNAFNLSSCFTVTERTGSTGSLEKKLNVSLNLNVDVVRGMSRGFFDQKDSSSRTLQQSVLLDPGFSCFNFSIFMLRCVKDTVSPLKIRMNLSQAEKFYGKSLAVLDIHSRTEEYVQVPFQRNCNSNNSCVADLKLNFSFTARPVMSVSAQLSFSPKEISLNYFECPGDSAFNAFNLSSCFTVTERTGSTGSLEKKLNVSLNLNVDVVRGMSRGFFDQKDSSSRTLQQSVLLDPGFSCFNFSIFMLRCVADTVSPLKIRMNLSQAEKFYGKSLAVLDIHSRTEEYVQVPFQRNCNSNNSCVADLKLNFSFTARPVMSVSAQLSFSPKEISLNCFECPGHNTFNTFNLTSCFTVTEKNRSTGVNKPLSCLSGSLEKTLNVSLNLNVDVVRGMSRGFFDQKDSSSRTLQQSVLLDPGFSCFNFSIFMLGCVADTVTLLKIRMNLSQIEMLTGNSVAVLDIHSRTEEYVEVSVKFVIPPNQMMLIVASSVGGGFIMYIIILVVLVKLGFFKRMRPQDLFQEDENVTLIKKTESLVRTSVERKRTEME
ncbi:integrin alpha-L-like isoform X1 [Labeo rohita]|uniref:integrin alpha-L-like isoform X1 n=1 Tax=Labeo rohita TaxID=84645 RepID=UPI0021E260EC|nr:integrin alpha-L-like isoform X1 [Labeo rohita]